jgi:hypothetical protein
VGPSHDELLWVLQTSDHSLFCWLVYLTNASVDNLSEPQSPPL